MTTITFNVEELEPLDILYLVDILVDQLDDPDDFTAPLRGLAWTIAGTGLHEGNDPFQVRQEGIAEELYFDGGQHSAEAIKEIAAKRLAHLRARGFVK